MPLSRTLASLSALVVAAGAAAVGHPSAAVAPPTATDDPPSPESIADADHVTVQALDEPRDGHFVTDNDGTQYDRQIVAEQANLYAWRPGYRKSGFSFHRQARSENCIAKYGCISTTHPSNIIRAHSDGTWSWWTGG